MIKTMEAPIIAPSILAADFSHTADGFVQIDESGAEWVHLDVMDGNFVPPISFGAKMVADLRPHSPAVFDVHLMVVSPERHIEDFARAGADYITFHVEAALHAHHLLGAIHDLGKKAGISIVPATPVSAIEPLLSLADLVLVMTVNPGYGGQPLIEGCLDKVRELRELRERGRGNYRISVDGGINLQTAGAAREAGADVLVTGSVFFAAPDKAALVWDLKGIKP